MLILVCLSKIISRTIFPTFGPIVRPKCCPPNANITEVFLLLLPIIGRLSGSVGLVPCQIVSLSYSSFG